MLDALAHHDRPDGEFVVASCDLYDVADGLITTITSCTVAP